MNLACDVVLTEMPKPPPQTAMQLLRNHTDLPVTNQPTHPDFILHARLVRQDPRVPTMILRTPPKIPTGLDPVPPVS